MHPAPLDTPPRPPSATFGTAARTALVLAALSALLLALVAFEWRPLLGLDEDITRAAHRWALDSPALTHTQRVLSDWVWDPWAMRPLCAVITGWLWWQGARWLALWVAATCALGTLLQQGLKAAVDRDRPVWTDPVDSAQYAAFPSGHALTATVVCGLLVWLLRAYGAGRGVQGVVGALAALSVLGVGVTRVWLGVHWPTDVLGGYLLGAFMVSLAMWTYERRHGTYPRRNATAATYGNAPRTTPPPDAPPPPGRGNHDGRLLERAAEPGLLDRAAPGHRGFPS